MTFFPKQSERGKYNAININHAETINLHLDLQSLIPPINKKIVVEFASKTIMELSVYCHLSPMKFGTKKCQKTIN